MNRDESTAKPIVGLLTDFGLVDPYVGEMKAIMFSICPEARVVDISHLVEKFNIRMGAFLLASATSAFPAGSVYVAVVDPGVGGERRPIVIETSRGLYVGPDNGLLLPAAHTENIRGVYEITNRKLMRDDVSSTFHGRDIFAPVGAHLACGLAARDCGPVVHDYVDPSYLQPKFNEKSVDCEVFHIDGFGNIITNLRNNDIQRYNLKATQNIRLGVGGKRMSARLVGTYSDLKQREIGLLLGSHGFVEIACRESSAAKRVRARTAMIVRISSA